MIFVIVPLQTLVNDTRITITAWYFKQWNMRKENKSEHGKKVVPVLNLEIYILTY